MKNINTIRIMRTSGLRALQELREDFELMLLDSEDRKNELLLNLRHDDSADGAIPLRSKGDFSVRAHRASMLIAYHDELAFSLRLNIRAVDRRALEIQRGLSS